MSLVERLRDNAVDLSVDPPWPEDTIEHSCIVVMREAADRITALEQERDRLRKALQGLHDNNVDYLRLNHLSGYDNHWLVAARAALAATGDKI